MNFQIGRLHNRNDITWIVSRSGHIDKAFSIILYDFAFENIEILLVLVFILRKECQVSFPSYI